MKPIIVCSGVLTLSATLLSGCGKSSSNSNEGVKDNAGSVPPNAPAAPAAAAPVTTAATTPVPSATDSQTPAAPAVATVPDSSATVPSAAAESVSQFATTAAAQTDKVAASVGSELAAKAKSLAQSAAGNSGLKTQLASALQSLSSGKEAGALSTLFREAKQANLTPQQTALVKDVGNLASAYVVQRNFSSLDGAQGDVATIVNSLRKGSMAPAVPALKSLAQNASLTPQQKDLLGTLADQYAPELKAATDSLKQGLQSLPGLTK